jgi:3-methyladenine DNA glycosylase AlkC
MSKEKLNEPIKSLVEKFKPQNDAEIKLGIALQSVRKKIRFENPQLEDLQALTKQENQITSNPEKLLDNRIQRIKSLFDRTEEGDRKQNGVEIYKRWAVSNFVIKQDKIPQAIYKLDQQIAINEGHGKIEITEGYKGKKNAEIIDGQSKSLETWIDYLTGPDAFYEDWYKYLVARSVPKMGKLDKAKWQYEKRSESSVSTFPELDSEALGIVQSIIKRSNGNKDVLLSEGFDVPELIKLGKTANFEKLYPQVQKKLKEGQILNIENKENIKGSWTKYDQGSDFRILEKSLENKNSGWCTASGSAKGQLETGDFYVYYSQDKDQNDTLPRIAIRMLDGKIKEIRGVLPNQDLEPELTEIMDEKASTLDGYENYQKATSDMKQMTEIAKLQEKNQELSPTQLRFLYEIDNKIQGFGQGLDPRIKENKSTRNEGQDLMQVFGCERDQLILEYSDDEKEIENDIQYIKPSLEWQLASSSRQTKVLEVLSKAFNDTTRESVAKNPNIPLKSQELLSIDPEINIRRNIAKNPNINPEILERLANDLDRGVYFEIGRNANTPTKVIEEFVRSQNDDKKASVVLNPNISQDALKLLSEDKSYYVRSNVAQNPSASIAIFEKLSQDSDDSVKQSLVENVNLPSALLEKLAVDESTTVRMTLANRKDLPTSVLERLSVDESDYVRRYVANNLKSSKESLTKLSSDASQYVRENVAKNPNTPIGTLLKLISDENWNVKEKAYYSIKKFKESFAEGNKSLDVKTKNYNLRVNL